MQVFYSRTGRNNVVSSYAGRRNETSIYSGKVGNGNRNVSGTSGYGAGKIGKDGEEVLEDSDIIKSLHKEVIRVVGNDYQSFPLNVECNSTEAGETDIITQMVNVDGIVNFDEIAFKLNEAMEVVLEYGIIWHILDNYDNLPHLFLRLEENVLVYLNKVVSEKEVKNSLYRIGGLKAHGSDGFPAMFFQN
ncbi:hypothetical protein QYF36_026029 [Acer negundo]|nr:hypothetical protein QYF36_026029 [Acer negundo]